jgi:hypothetical protein
LSDNGIKIDFSMVAPYRTEQTLKYQNIYQHLLDFWGYRTESLAPIAREFEEQKIFQIPNNFAHPGIIPYKKAKSLLKQVFSAINRDTYNGSTVSLMISQNRLYSDLPQVEEFTKEIFKQAIENKIDFNLLVNSPIYLDPESVKLSKAGTWAWPNLSVNNLKAKF